MVYYKMERLESLSKWLRGSCSGVLAQGLILEERAGPVCILSLNSPKTLNAISPQMIAQLNQAVKKADEDRSIKAIVICGEGRCFSAGADLKHLSTFNLPKALEKDPFESWYKVIPLANTPIIAAVHGFALGGGFELAMMCDIIVAHERTKFGLPEIKVGLIPAAGGTQMLTREVGSKLAMDMILSGEPVTATELASHGCISEIAPYVKEDRPGEAVRTKALALA